jgi:hypothetical protein
VRYALPDLFQLLSHCQKLSLLVNIRTYTARDIAHFILPHYSELGWNDVLVDQGNDGEVGGQHNLYNDVNVQFEPAEEELAHRLEPICQL